MSSEKMKTALIVEDSKSTAEIYKSLLEEIGEYKTNIAEIGKIEEQYGKEYNFIILDGLNGNCFEFYEKLNGKRKIICTGDESIFDKAKGIGIEAFLKPISFLDILNK